MAPRTEEVVVLCAMMLAQMYRHNSADVEHWTPTHRHAESRAGLHCDTNMKEVEANMTLEHLR